MKPEIWNEILVLLKNLVWASVALTGLYWIAKPVAEGLGQWMTRASPDKFLDALFSYPTAIVVVVLLVGPKRVQGYFESLLERGFKGLGFEIPPQPAIPGKSPPPSSEPPIPVPEPKQQKGQE